MEKQTKTDPKRLERNRKWRAENKEKFQESQRAYAIRNKEKLAARAKQRLENNPVYAEKRRKAQRECSRRRFRQIRAKIYELLGGAKCNCCGTEDVRVLCVHHVNGGGNAEREGITKSAYAKKLLEQAEVNPSEFEVLCLNCHAIKHYIE